MLLLQFGVLKAHLWCSWFCSRMGRRLNLGYHPWVVCGARDAVVIRRWGCYKATKLRREICMLVIEKCIEEKARLP